MCLVAAGLLYGSLRFVEANLESIRGDWLKYARGLDDERLVSWSVDDRGSEWHVFHGLQLRQDQNFGPVLVGPSDLFTFRSRTGAVC
jgi:hypothetical protein